MIYQQTEGRKECFLKAVFNHIHTICTHSVQRHACSCPILQTPTEINLVSHFSLSSSSLCFCQVEDDLMHYKLEALLTGRSKDTKRILCSSSGVLFPKAPKNSKCFARGDIWIFEGGDMSQGLVFLAEWQNDLRHQLMLDIRSKGKDIVLKYYCGKSERHIMRVVTGYKSVKL